MIIICHHNNKVESIIAYESSAYLDVCNESIAQNIVRLARLFPDDLLFWYHKDCQEDINWEALPELFNHKKILLSYGGTTNYIPSEIGYVDESLFVNPDKESVYPTWQMSSLVGGIYGGTLNALEANKLIDTNFDYFLCSLAKIGMPHGLLCYNEPQLLKKITNRSSGEAGIYSLFKFVKEHYRARWILLLFVNLLIYERRFPVLACLYTVFFKRKKPDVKQLDKIQMELKTKSRVSHSLDVIIPTIGRKVFLYDVLKDLSKQTIIPKKVIIVEQNPLEGSTSELDYLEKESWPFQIKHLFTHRTGACNARNQALQHVEQEWVFFADDDIRFEKDFLETAFKQIEKTGNSAFTICCLRKGDKPVSTNIFQWTTFGSGCSIVKSEAIADLRFDDRYEHGFGEDTDFGMQLRNKDCDILYLPSPELLHLKAPVGGFRTEVMLEWNNDRIKPKPSPTVMLFKLRYNTKEQLRSYKTTLFLKFYKHQEHKHPVKYYNNFKKSWERSIYWANILRAGK